MIINPDAPDPYKYETDYRKVPRQYLNPRIPHGRGKIKWQPFATLPEQFETIKQYMHDQNKVERPLLSDDQLNELNCQLHQALHHNRPVQVEFFNDGWIETITLEISRIDTLQLFIEGHTQTNPQTVKLSLLDITRIAQIEH